VCIWQLIKHRAHELTTDQVTQMQHILIVKKLLIVSIKEDQKIANCKSVWKCKLFVYILQVDDIIDGKQPKHSCLLTV